MTKGIRRNASIVPSIEPPTQPLHQGLSGTSSLRSCVAMDLLLARPSAVGAAVSPSSGPSRWPSVA